MRSFLRAIWFGILSLALCLPVPAAAQPSAEGAAEFTTDRLENLQTLAEQYAAQAGKFAGRTVGPKLGSVSNSLVQILTNFDVYACGAAVTALGLKHRELAVAAAMSLPADPELDRAVSDLGNLIAQLQELCNRFVYDAGQPGAASPATPAPPPVVETPPPPSLSVQERICYERCRRLYDAFFRGQIEYERARSTAEEERRQATQARQEANAAAERARTAQQRVETVQREFDRLQAALTASRNQAERLRIAEQLARVNPTSAREFATTAQQAAEQAARDAQLLEDRAARSERRASIIYDALLEIYEALQRCARDCAQQARDFDKVEIDLSKLFPGMPATAPPRPPFYRPPPPVPQAAVPPATRAQTAQTGPRVVTTPQALSGGVLTGAVYDGEGEPRQGQRVAVIQPNGSRETVRTATDGSFALTVAGAAGELALGLPGTPAEAVRLEVIGSVPAGMPAGIPDFVELGGPMTVAAPYRQVTVVNAQGLEFEVPVSTAVGPDGATGLSSFAIPRTVGTGPVTVHAVGLDGQEMVFEVGSYAVVRGWIDNERLRSGQDAQFGYELDFGSGPMTVTAVITASGPIIYARNGQPQVIEVGADGKAQVTDRIRALRGSPTGIPFRIGVTFTRGR